MKRGDTDNLQANHSENAVGHSLTRGGVLKLAGIGVLILILLSAVVYISFTLLPQGPGVGVILTTPLPTSIPDSISVIHTFPVTTEGIHVFNDQLAVWEMTEAQYEFAATHYTGTQKIFASDTRRLRAHNPDFITLNYRLGLGLGYQRATADCQPTGEWLEVIEGEKWVREYPQAPQESWFFEWGDQRILHCQWGWYVMDLEDASWREYWSNEVLRQLQANQADGVFVDGLIVPNYFGGDQFDPPLPEIDVAFEQTWSANIEDFIAYMQTGELADYYFVVNVGNWVTGRDITDYSGADGVLVVGFARWDEGGYFDPQDGDWQLQMDRILGFVNLDKILLLQQYIDHTDLEDRMFLLGSYLLVKGRYTYLNFELSPEPEWFPEYEIPVGSPIGDIPSTISALWRSDWKLYARNYSNGLTLVNPANEKQIVDLGATYYQATPHGGGVVPPDGDISEWAVEYTPVTNLILEPNQAAVLLIETP